MVDSVPSTAGPERREFARLVSWRLILWIPIATALLYPWSLRLFHALIADHRIAASVTLIIAFALPLICLLIAYREGSRVADGTPTVQRIALSALAAPPLFVLVGVLKGLTHVPLGDIWIWSLGWISVGLGATLIGGRKVRPDIAKLPSGRLRVIHGVSASVILVFVAFHLSNHLADLGGPRLHATVMAIGRTVYRAPTVEPVLVALLLFQVAGVIELMG